MNTLTTTADLITTLLRRICDRIILHPDQLQVTVTQLRTSLVVRLRAHISDTARLIGEKGVMFRSLKAIVQEIGNRHSVTVDMERIEEPLRGTPDRFTRFKANEGADIGDLGELLLELLRNTMRDSEAVDMYWEHNGIEAKVECGVSLQEPVRTVDAMHESLRTIFTAIGKARGRLIYLNIVNDQPPTPKQSTTSKGRYA